MATSLYSLVSFGSGKASLATVGYQLVNADNTNNGSRITAGVQDLTGGQYGALVSFPTGFQGRIKWDTGEASPAYASDSVNPADPAILAAIAALAALPAFAVTPAFPTGTDLALLRGDTITVNLTGLGNLTGRSKLWFTLKEGHTDADSAALVQILEAGGLVRLNGAAATASDGSIVVTDATTGALTITLKPAAAALLAVGRGKPWDVQVLNAGVVRTPVGGTATVTGDVTLATS
ncbi:MAG TPA: hypothetical protein VGP44_05610 [Gemmatimonadales bacterium]|nr:hypothetical protein [Gemmatimonadales bacterium]